MYCSKASQSMVSIVSLLILLRCSMYSTRLGGFGVQKDGKKLHGFKYECISNTRSKDLFGDKIDAARDAEDVLALATVLVAAYSDLILSGNDDMTSYLYLTENAIYALSDPVKKAIGDLKNEGGVALGLVTELVATASSAEGLFIKAVQPRIDDEQMGGIEALNEANLKKVYAAITPMVQTRGCS
jgi:hypothetical protein